MPQWGNYLHHLVLSATIVTHTISLLKQKSLKSKADPSTVFYITESPSTYYHYYCSLPKRYNLGHLICMSSNFSFILWRPTSHKSWICAVVQHHGVDTITHCAGLHLISVMLCGENKSPNSTSSFYYEKNYTFLNLVPCVEHWLLHTSTLLTLRCFQQPSIEHLFGNTD